MQVTECKSPFVAWFCTVRPVFVPVASAKAGARRDPLVLASNARGPEI